MTNNETKTSDAPQGSKEDASQQRGIQDSIPPFCGKKEFGRIPIKIDR